MADPAPPADELFAIVLNLVQELWIVKDRQIVLEHVLAEHGIDAAAAVDALQPDAALTARLSEERQQLLAKCLGPAAGTQATE